MNELSRAFSKLVGIHGGVTVQASSQFASGAKLSSVSHGQMPQGFDVPGRSPRRVRMFPLLPELHS
jgi:hypothetical protein